MKKHALALTLALCTSAGFAAEIERVVSYGTEGPEYAKITHPDPEPGQKIVVVKVPRAEGTRVEFNFSKKVTMDPCNRAGFDGTLEKKEVSYFDYHVLTVGGMTMTLMGCNGKVERDIGVYTDTKIEHPGSEEVFYVPEDVEVSYTIWTAGEPVKVEALKLK